MAKNNHHYFSLHFISSTFFFVSFLFTTELSASTESFQEWYIKGMEERAHGNFLSSENFFKKATENNPKNPAVWHMLGLSQAYNKKYSAALESLKKASYYSPKDIDIKLDIILILAWSQDYDQATEELNNILRQKPYCAEAHFLKGRIYYYRGNLNAAKISVIEALRLDPANQEAKKFLNDIENKIVIKNISDINLWKISSGHIYSFFSKSNNTPWNETYLQLNHKPKKNIDIHGKYQIMKRFDMHDNYYEWGLDYIFSPEKNGYFFYGYTNKSIFMPLWRLAAGGSVPIWHQKKSFHNLYINLDLKKEIYRSNNIKTITPGLKHYITENFLISGKYIKIYDVNVGHMHGWSALCEATILHKIKILLELGKFPESDSGKSTVTASKTIGISYFPNDRFSIRLDASREVRKDSYVRNFIHSGIIFRF